jgi:hypothetical protein
MKTILESFWFLFGWGVTIGTLRIWTASLFTLARWGGFGMFIWLLIPTVPSIIRAIAPAWKMAIGLLLGWTWLYLGLIYYVGIQFAIGGYYSVGPWIRFFWVPRFKPGRRFERRLPGLKNPWVILLLPGAWFFGVISRQWALTKLIRKGWGVTNAPQPAEYRRIEPQIARTTFPAAERIVWN